MSLPEWTIRLLAVVAGILVAVFMLAISVSMAGVGHGGWFSAFVPSILGLIGVPMVAAAWASVSERGRHLAMVSLSIAIIADIVVLPGFLFDWRMLMNFGFVGVLWTALFVGWHAAAIARIK